MGFLFRFLQEDFDDVLELEHDLSRKPVCQAAFRGSGNGVSFDHDRVAGEKQPLSCMVDPAGHLTPFSGTLTKLGRSLLLQYTANMKWEIASFDIKTASLRGTASKDRVLGLEPVQNSNKDFKCRKPRYSNSLREHMGERMLRYCGFKN